jgi:hypothetical protein
MATDNTSRSTADRMDFPVLGLTTFSVPTRVPGLGTPDFYGASCFAAETLTSSADRY